MDVMTDFEQFGHNIHNRPAIGKSLGLIDYNFPKISEEQLQQLYGKTEIAELRKPLLKRVLDTLFT